MRVVQPPGIEGAGGFERTEAGRLPLSDEEREWRQRSVASARGSVRLSGFVLDAETEDLARRYVAGELTGDEFAAAVIAAARR